MEPNAWQKREQRLEAIEAALASGHKTIDVLFERASLLSELGQTERAKQAYLDLLHQDPIHFGALNNLGALLYAGGFWDAALTVFAEAVARYPDKPVVHFNLANLLYHKNELDDARRHYEEVLRLDPHHASAHQCLSILFDEIGEVEKAQHHRTLGYGNQPMKTFPYHGSAEAIPLLLLISSTGSDLPWRRLVDDRVFQVTTLAAAFYDQATPLPPHRLVFNVIGDADSAQVDLEAAQRLVQRTQAPVINSPAAVLATGRISNAERMRDIAGVITPRITLLPRAVLEKADAPQMLAEHGFRFPLLLRSPGFHMGKYFTRVDSADALRAALQTLPGKELLVMDYLDATGHDGCARKYRVMMIGGKLYPLHLAISNIWKVHYYTAAMAGNVAHQAEEQAFLQDMPKALGPKAMAALRVIQEKLALDFGGIDFGINMEGDLLLFEANASMLIVPPNNDPQWDYRRAAIGRALQAARELVLERAKAKCKEGG